ncbi:MAG: LPS export ABC transporter periplasmic protein LptC [Flavobacteriales bacterium]
MISAQWNEKMYTFSTKIFSSIGLIFLICCGEKTGTSSQKEKIFASRIFVRAQVISKDSGLVKINLKAPLIEEYAFIKKEKPYTLFPKGLKLYYYENNKNQPGSLQADWAKIFDEEKYYEARGNVTIVNPSKDTLKTSHLLWNRKERKIYNDVPTEIYRIDGTILNAKKGLEGSDDLKEITLKNTDGLIHLNQYPAS